MHHNQLTSLSSGVFNLNFNLTDLDLSENKLTSLPPEVFKDLTKLIDLKSHNNQFTSFSPDVLRLNSNLVRLDLSYNKLIKLDSSTFKGLTKDQNIGLEANHISEIDRNTFNELDQIRTVCFISNPVVGLFPDLVNMVIKIKSEYPIQTLDSDLFEVTSVA